MKPVWFGDFEFHCPDGETPKPLCFVARELYSTEWVKLNSHEFGNSSPIPKDSIFVAYAADAEIKCFLALGWELPDVIDLHIEYLNFKNYLERTGKFEDSALLLACADLGIECASQAEKDRGRAIAMQGGPRSSDEAKILLDYCQSDVEPLLALYRKLIGPGNINQAIERGRFMKAVARMETFGIPIDTVKLNEFREKWESIKFRLVDEMDQNFKVYDGVKFSHDKFKSYVARRGFSWPVTPCGLLKTDRDTFKQLILLYPELAPLHELKSTLSLMKRESICVGSDGRNRTSLHAFRSKTSRNQPGSTKFIFGAPSWMRSFVKPENGMALAYIDYAQEEFLIAAALSEDEAMLSAYESGDPYLEFAKLARAIPLDATKESHPKERELYKTVSLGIQYAMQAAGLAQRLGKSIGEAEILLDHHRTQFPQFWHWVDRVVAHMEFNRKLCTKSGWRVVRKSKNLPARWRRSLQNWPIQSAGADLLRAVCCETTEQGIKVVAPVHDALVVEDSVDRIEQTVAKTQEIMRQESLKMFGHEIRSESEIFHNRFIDKRGVSMWERINQLMAEDGERPGDQMRLFEVYAGQN
jgi:DNA polymerase-1